MLIGQDILVIGGGIGGLAAAAALAQRGARVRVLEQSPAITEVGAGIQISPNGARVLVALGIDVPGAKSTGIHLMDGLSGQSLLRMALPTNGHGFWLCHRADLIGALLHSAKDSGVEIILGAKVSQVHPGQRPFVTLVDGSTLEASLIVGADGLHAPSRKAVLETTEPFFTGQVAWRALVKGGDHPPEARVHTGPGAHVVTYPLRNVTVTNIVAVEEQTAWQAEGWSHQGDPGAFRDTFAGFSDDLGMLFERVETVHKWGLFRHPIASSWVRDNVILLGDAAHPTLPFLAQGGVMALEDAWVLAACLAVAPQDEALARYEGLRLARVTKAIDAANANARNYHLRGFKRWGANHALRVINRLAPQRMLDRFSWLYDHDVTQEV